MNASAQTNSATPVQAGPAAGRPRHRRTYQILIALGSLLTACALWAWLVPYYWRAAAQAAIRARELDRARALLTKTVQRLPGDVSSRLRLAQLLDIAGETQQAVEHLYRLPEDMLGREDVLVNLGRMLIELDRPTEAEAFLKRCVQQYPQTVRARQLLLDLYVWQHRDVESQVLRAELDALARSKSISDRLWLMIRCFFEDYSRIDDQENWEHLLRCWNRDKQDPVVRIAMARHLILQGDRVQEAAQDLESLLPFNPDSVSAIASLVEYYLNIECRSIDRAEELLLQWPEQLRFSLFWRYDGQIQEQRNDETAAIASYRRALAYRPDDLPSISRLATLLVRIARSTGDSRMLEEGTALAERVHRLHQTRLRATNLWGQITKWLDQWDRATQGMDDPPAPDILHEMADFYAQLGRTPESQMWSAVSEELESSTKNSTQLRAGQAY